MNDDDRYTDRWLKQVETGFQSDVRLMVYLGFHLVWLWVASWAYRLGELWDRFLGNAAGPAFIGWTFAVITFLLLAFLWNRKIYGGWRF